jgi:hypothetical protein
VLLPNNYISHDAELSALLRPLWDAIGVPGIEPYGGSFWIVT